MQWINTEEKLPEIDSSNFFDLGWRLCNFGGNKFATARYIETHKKWQLFDYNWSRRDPDSWLSMTGNKTIQDLLMV